MLKSYFLLAWRNLQKHKTSAAINIGGLALGLTTSILVLLFVVDEFGYDRFHRNIADLYLLMKNQQQADGKWPSICIKVRRMETVIFS